MKKILILLLLLSSAFALTVVYPFMEEIYEVYDTPGACKTSTFTYPLYEGDIYTAEQTDSMAGTDKGTIIFCTAPSENCDAEYVYGPPVFTADSTILQVHQHVVGNGMACNDGEHIHLGFKVKDFYEPPPEEPNDFFIILSLIIIAIAVAIIAIAAYLAYLYFRKKKPVRKKKKPAKKKKK